MKNRNLCSIIKIARRHNNKKRSYLLVNTVQAKHIPTRPNDAMRMYRALGEKLKNAYPSAKLVIGFAETATAIASAAALTMGEDVRFIHTTRQQIDDSKCLIFCEEHSHAVEQKLFVEGMEELISATDEIVFIDDEISTGKTVFNIITEMRGKYPQLEGRKIVVGSILSRLTAEREAFFREHNIIFESLYRIICDDSRLEMSEDGLEEAVDLRNSKEPTAKPDIRRLSFPEPKYPCVIGEYADKCRDIAEKLMEQINFSRYRDVLFIGTEECMFPSIIAAKLIEERCGIKAFCHSTTRSPISIGHDPEYPIQNGFIIKSLYTAENCSFIYDLRHYDAAVVISDCKAPVEGSLELIDLVLSKQGIVNKYYFLGE